LSITVETGVLGTDVTGACDVGLATIALCEVVGLATIALCEVVGLATIALCKVATIVYIIVAICYVFCSARIVTLSC
jgi:hypothetical protein